MPKSFIRVKYCTIILLLFVCSKVYTQASLCPPNIDFQFSDFTNWECRSGFVTGTGGINTVTWLGSTPDPNRHLIIPTTSPDRDLYGGFPIHCPNAVTPSVKLGSSMAGHEADGLFYTFTIPATATKFSLLYQYAIVLQNPGHLPHEQPRFRARIIDVATDKEVNCVSFDFTSSGSLPGFQQSSTMSSVIYKDWTPVSVDLSMYAGRTIRLEFITTDCIFQEHFGYAYINVSSVCNGTIMGSSYCAGDTTTVLTAPFGFASYQWFSDNTFSNQIGNTQNLQLAIQSTPVGSELPVIIHPYPGYGCTDTLFATIGLVQKPLANAGPDIINCSKQQAVLGVAGSNLYEYSWNLPQLLSNPHVSNPTLVSPLLVATDFIVKATDLLSGCFAVDTATVTPILVDTTSMSTGGLTFCPRETPAVSLQVVSTATAVQWYRNESPISGATELTYEPPAEGTYWAQLKQAGCIDTSRQYVLRQAAMPRPAFITNREMQCVGKPVAFVNQTTIANNEPVSYEWQFSDGSTATTANTDKSFALAGEFTATLIATSGANCSDSIQKNIVVINNCNPVLPTAFTPNKDGKNDILKPSLMASKGLKRFAVYNRWGNLVFSTTREGEGWDGTNKGIALQTDVFVWMLEYINADNRAVIEKGTVTLIR